jgi:DNA mismatch repair protein MSH6
VELFVGKASEWTLVINALSTIDVLRSFAAVKVSSFGTMCRPHVLAKDNVPILRMKGLWHPYALAESTNGLVPNDLSIGQDLSGLNRFALLLTGPNMGGKSTTMRATCLAVILAQVWCFKCIWLLIMLSVLELTFWGVLMFHLVCSLAVLFPASRVN